MGPLHVTMMMSSLSRLPRAAFVEDEATKRAIAASLRDQQEQEERARRQQPGAPARELLGANGAPTALKGGTIGWVAISHAVASLLSAAVLMNSAAVHNSCEKQAC